MLAFKKLYVTMQKRGNEMDGLSLDVLKQIKHDEIRNRILIIVISACLLIVTNALWFIRWNAPPKEKDEITIEFEEEDNDTPQSDNEKSE